MNEKLVTIGVPLYNHSPYIVECLASLVQQSYQPIEIIVIDDGSTDDSYEVAKRYLESQTHNKNYQISSRKNRGMCHTLNEIAHKAQGEFISFIGSDDFWTLDKVADQAAYLQTNPDITLVHSSSVQIDASGQQLREMRYRKKIKSGYLFQDLVKGLAKINTTSHMYRHSVYEDIGFYDPAFSFEDTDFWLRLSKNHKVGFIDVVHCHYRWHGKNLSDPSNDFIFYNDQCVSIYRKNVDDPQLLSVALRKIYKRACKKAWRSGRYRLAYEQFLRYVAPLKTYKN